MAKRGPTGYRRQFKPKRQKREYYGRGAMVIAPQQRGYVRTTGFYGRFAKGGGEQKFFDTDLDAIFGTIGTTMELANLNIIVQGNTESNRIGRKVILKRVDCKGILTLPTTATNTATSEVVRLLLVCDKQTNGAAFAGTDIWETDNYRSFNNLANSTRFRILQSKVITLNATAGSGRGTTDTLDYAEWVVPWKMGVNLNLPIEFDNSATTGAVTTQRSNSLWLVSQSTTGLAIMSVSNARVRFMDG